METPIAPGPRRSKRAPLPTTALLVGGTLCVLAIVSAAAPVLMSQLAHDALVMRALGVTVGFAGFMLGFVAVKASAGSRRIAALVVAAPLAVIAMALLARPDVALWFYDTGRAIFVPWVLGIPAVLALLLSRWRVR